MSDLIHNIDLIDNIFTCTDCGVHVPYDVGILGDNVVELGGAGTHWLPKFAYDGKAKSCGSANNGKAVLVCIKCDGAGCEECNFDGLICSDGSPISATQAAPEGGEVIESAPAKTEHEKMVARMSIQNFVNMREATRPE
jgi:hypothetical protein